MSDFLLWVIFFMTQAIYYKNKNGGKFAEYGAYGMSFIYLLIYFWIDILPKI